MNDVVKKNQYFSRLHGKSHRLAAAVFIVSDSIDDGEEIKNKIKNLSLSLVSMSVMLKDAGFSDAKKIISEIENRSLELMSMIDIASVAGLISSMNAKILKEEFESFVLELNRSYNEIEVQNGSIQSVFLNSPKTDQINGDFENVDKIKSFNYKENNNGLLVDKNTTKNHKRKDSRKNSILEFIKGHKDVSIKDIVPNIVGCSEKTIQRELIDLINEGKIKKVGERRWTKYSIA